jgi:DnaJ-class molecular chaperone
VRIQVWVPRKLTAKEKELLKELSKLEHIVPTEEEQRGAKSFFEKVKDAFS